MAVQNTAAGGPVPMMPGMGGASNGQIVDGGVPVTNPSQPSTGVAGSNVFAAPGSTTTVPTSTTQNRGINFTNVGSNTVGGDFNQVYGAGTGQAIGSVLSNMGTQNDAAIQATIAQVNQEAGIQGANIASQEAAAGITPNSSSAALAQGDFQAQVNTGLQSTVANMENNQEQTLLSALTNEGTAHGTDSSFLGSLGDVLSGNESAISALVGGGANALNETGASGTGGFSEILTALGGLA